MKRLRRQLRFFWLPGLLLLAAGAAYPQLTLSPAPPVGSVASVALPTGFTTKVYLGATLSTNGVGPTDWTTKGNLPPGLQFNANTPNQTSATITGTPTSAGKFVFDVSASDPQFEQTVTHSYSITVAVGLDITTSPTLVNATLGANYSASLSATGGTPPYTWFINSEMSGFARPRVASPSVSTALPGVTLSSGGVLSGIPTQTGTFTIPVGVNDSDQINPQLDFRTFTLTVSPAPSLEGGTLPGGTLGVPYLTSLIAQGGSRPFIFVATEGFLPQGLALFASGVISGTPTQTGTFPFTVAATDIWGASVSANYTLTISSALTITTFPPLNNGAVGSPYNLTFTASGSPPYTWSVISGTLPAGLTLSPGGVLSGTPTAAGAFQFTVQVTDKTTRAVADAFNLTIAPQLVITTAVLPDATAGTPYPAGQKIAATGGTPPYTFSTTGSFPAGLTLNSSTGAITGTPTQGGPNSFTAQVTDSAGIIATKTLAINVIAIVFTTPSPLPGATFGVAYNQSIAVTGATPPDTFTIDSGTLPGGITLSVTGALAGTPTALGNFSFVVRVTDANKSTGTQAYQLTVAPPALQPPTVTGVTATEQPAQQPTASVQLASAYPVDLTVTFTLTFASAVGNVDDPAIAFSSNGKRTTQVTIPAGSTTSPNVQFSTGTVAGTITLTLDFQIAGGQDVTPTPAPTQVIQIAAAAPVITAVTAQNNSSGLEVDVTGFSNTREIVSASFQFQAAAGTNLQTSQVPITADQLFATWYSDPTSQQYGSRFTYAQQFTISGNMTGISGVTVTLTNKQGTSNAVTASVQ